MDGGNSPIDLTDREEDLFLEDNLGSNVHEYTGGNGKDVTSLVTFIIQSASFLLIFYFIYICAYFAILLITVTNMILPCLFAKSYLVQLVILYASCYVHNRDGN